jgi:hypothetical protein
MARAERALAELRRLLDVHETGMHAVDAAGLDAIEATFMRGVRVCVPCARLIGVPAGMQAHWLEYARLYCAYLVASGMMPCAPCTMFVAIPGQRGLEVCLMRISRRGRVRLLC